MARLIVNADDFGLHLSVNKAIENCFRFGSVNSTSVMANGSALDIPLLLKLSDKGLLTGVHITWVNEPWLTQNIYIHSWRQLLHRMAFGGSAFITQMKQEAEAQVELLLRQNIPLHHIDSHQHVHHLPGLWTILKGLQLKHSIPRIRVAHVCHKSLLRKNISGFVLNYLAGRYANHTTYCCVGIKHAGNYTLDLLRQELEISSGVNTELIVHPGINNAELNNRYSHWSFNWEQEYGALMEPGFLFTLKEAGLKFH